MLEFDLACSGVSSVSLWLGASVIPRHAVPRKTGGVMRFGEHFCAADFYKQGKSRGNCVKTGWEWCSGAVGFLINGAQRARANPRRRLAR